MGFSRNTNATCSSGWSEDIFDIYSHCTYSSKISKQYQYNIVPALLPRTVLLKKMTQPSCGSHGRKLLLAKNSNALENLNHVFPCLAPLSGVHPLCLAGEEPHIEILKLVFLECSWGSPGIFAMVQCIHYSVLWAGEETWFSDKTLSNIHSEGHLIEHWHSKLTAWKPSSAVSDSAQKPSPYSACTSSLTQCPPM